MQTRRIIPSRSQVGQCCSRWYIRAGECPLGVGWYASPCVSLLQFPQCFPVFMRVTLRWNSIQIYLCAVRALSLFIHVGQECTFCFTFCFTFALHFALRPQKRGCLLGTGTGGKGGRGRKSEGSTADTTRKRPERPVHRAIAVSTAVLGQSHKDNVLCTAVEEQLEAKEVQLSQPSSTSLLMISSGPTLGPAPPPSS